MGEPHPLLIPLLEEFGISWEIFSKRGRPAKGVKEKRQGIVTRLHESGRSWAEIQEITGLSTPGIHRLTQAVGCKAAKEKQRKLGKKVGSSWKGKKRPGQLQRQWEAGVFDGLVGRKRPKKEIENIKKSWTAERRESFGEISKARWEDPEYKERLLSYHRSPSERRRRSEAQAKRMVETPEKYTRGNGSYVVSKKSVKPKFWVRSSFEVAAVERLDKDDKVVCFWYEYRLKLPGGKYILPDFLLVGRDDSITVLEVKAKWVFGLSEDSKEKKRLRKAEKEAKRRGWGFEVWTEEELF